MDTVPHCATRLMPQRTQVMHGRFSAAARIFITRHQTLGGAMPRTHAGLFNFQYTPVQPASARRRSVLASDHLNEGGTNVDLSLRLNVMAVTAVFLFVGAILLGAF